MDLSENELIGLLVLGALLFLILVIGAWCVVFKQNTQVAPIEEESEPMITLMVCVQCGERLLPGKRHCCYTGHHFDVPMQAVDHSEKFWLMRYPATPEFLPFEVPGTDNPSPLLE